MKNLIADKAVEPVLRWSEREKRPLDYYGERITIANGKPKEPTTLKKILQSQTKSSGQMLWKKKWNRFV